MIRATILLRSWLVACLTIIGVPAMAGFVYTESSNGELSEDNLAPTPLGIVTAGSNTVTGAVGGGDADIFRVDIPTGFRLDSLILTSFSTTAPSVRMFASIDDGPTYAYTVQELNNGPDLSLVMGAGLVGARFVTQPPIPFREWGTGVGDDMLQFLGGSDRLGGTGFTPPLPAGSYSIYLQETGNNSNYSLSFNVSAVPEPSCLSMLGLLTLGCCSHRRRICPA